jgi:3'(2'), 5'-bisphosphate nucleotidase
MKININKLINLFYHYYSRRFWTLDPIDGTLGFLRREQYAVCLALVVDGDVAVGVLGCPNLPCPDHYGCHTLYPHPHPSATLPAESSSSSSPSAKRGCLFFAIKGGGSFMTPLGDASLLTPPVPIKVSDLSDVTSARGVQSVESRHTSHDLNGAAMQAMATTATPSGSPASPKKELPPMLKMDSQCKYAVVARGDVEAYVRLVPPSVEHKIWDHAAGCLIVEEAGGTVTDSKGKRLDFGAGRTLANNSRGILATNGHVHDALVAAATVMQKNF